MLCNYEHASVRITDGVYSKLPEQGYPELDQKNVEQGKPRDDQGRADSGAHVAGRCAQ